MPVERRPKLLRDPVHALLSVEAFVLRKTAHLRHALLELFSPTLPLTFGQLPRGSFLGHSPVCFFARRSPKRRATPNLMPFACFFSLTSLP